MILVTGGTGFLGTHLVEKLLEEEEEVRCLYRTHFPEELAGKVEWVKGDILDVVSLEEALKGVTYVYHCAGMVSYDPRKKREVLKINAEGTANVVNACLEQKVRKLLHVSSVAAVGRSAISSEVKETLKWQKETNRTAYSKSKHLAEMEVLRGEAEGLEVDIVNPSLILGPAKSWDQGSPQLVKRVANGFSFYPAGTTGFVDVRDVAALMIRLMKSDISGERFILNSENWPYERVFKTIAREVGVNTKFKEATAFLTGIVWRFVWLKSVLTGGKREITRQTARTAAQTVLFGNSKIQEAFPDFQWRSLSQTITDTCCAFLNSKDTPEIS